MSDHQASPNRLDKVFKTLVVVALVIYGMVLIRDIVLPMVFAGIFAVVLSPVALAIEKKTGRIMYSFQAGAGIVADSIPEREHDEVLAKSAILRRALEIAEEGL
jgi:predicted PurR-regulated permease PerM